MDFSAITQIIGSLGFPIAMCLMLFYRMDKQDEQHREENSKLVESLNNNTLAITKLQMTLENKEVIEHGNER